MLFATLTMLLLATAALPFSEARINQQHIVNEIVFYIMCSALVVYAGAITDPYQTKVLGWLLIALFTLFVLYNIVMILYDMLSHLKLLCKRYKENLKGKISLKRLLSKLSHCLCCSFCKNRGRK